MTRQDGIGPSGHQGDSSWRTIAHRFLGTPTDLGADATRDISAGLGGLLADVFALYLKTKNFHWHMSGPNFRDYHLLLDDQGDQIFAMTDAIAERAPQDRRHHDPLDLGHCRAPAHPRQ